MIAGPAGDVAYFCAQCGSAAVEVDALAGAGARCRGCGWAGRKEELIGQPFAHAHGAPGQILEQLGHDLRMLLSQKDVAVPLLRLLRTWGFLEEPVSARLAGRYVAAVARGIARSLLEEREAIDLETRAPRNPSA